MLRLMMVERDKEPCWGCSTSAEGGAAAAGRAATVGKAAAVSGAAAAVGGAAAAVVKAGECLLSNKQCRAQGNSEADCITQHGCQQRWLAQCQSMKVDSIKVSWWSSCCDPAGGEKINS